MKKEGPVLVGLIVGLVVIVSNFFASATMTKIKGELDQWFLVAQAFAVVVGMINLARIHGDKIARKREGWPFSVTLYIGMFGFLLFGLWRGSAGDAMFQWMYNTTISPMNATMYSVLVFYIASAAYRAFRIRTPEATVLLVSAVIMMLGRVTVGAMIHKDIPTLASWILDVPNTAGMRGITVGATLGGISTALRIMTGIERGHLGGTE